MRRRILALILAVSALASACGASDTSDQTSQVDAATSATSPPAAATATEVTAGPELTVPPEPTLGSEPAEPPEPTEPPEPVAGSFYDAPGALQVPVPLPPAPPGTIIDTETLPLALSNVDGQRILYHSQTSQLEDIAVSGFVLYPGGEPPEGGWPLLAWAHGTTGLGDFCAPSSRAIWDEWVFSLVDFGYAVVATDYEGLGTPGTHPYLVGLSEARGVLDSVRAVQGLGLPISSEFVAFGISQGGHAAMFTGQIQNTYAPELDMIGVVAAAPPSQFKQLLDYLVGTRYQSFIVMYAVGLAAANDELDLTDVFSPQALELIDVLETGCVQQVFRTYNRLDYRDTTLVDDPFAQPGWVEAFAANDTNQFPVPVPLLILHGDEDEQIPVETSATLVDQLCALDGQGPIQRNVYEGQSHAGILTTGAAVPDLLAWIEGRFAGQQAPDQCPGRP